MLSDRAIGTALGAPILPDPCNDSRARRVVVLEARAEAETRPPPSAERNAGGGEVSNAYTRLATEREEIRSAIEYAPRVKSTVADLSGFWTKGHGYVCADCSARLIGRGYGHFLKTPVYVGETRGCCVGCEPLRDESGDLL